MSGPNGAVIDSAFVRHWSALYSNGSRERDLLDHVGPAVSQRGWFTRDELLAVGRWKSARALGRLNKNSDDDIAEITRIALAAPARLQHRILTLLHGVAVPMASAMLTVWNPAEHTVIDVRAIQTLRVHGELGDGDVYYLPYLQLCREIALRVECDLRTLDRALWQWSRERGRKVGTENTGETLTGDGVAAPA